MNDIILSLWSHNAISHTVAPPTFSNSETAPVRETTRTSDTSQQASDESLIDWYDLSAAWINWKQTLSASRSRLSERNCHHERLMTALTSFVEHQRAQGDCTPSDPAFDEKSSATAASVLQSSRVETSQGEGSTLMIQGSLSASPSASPPLSALLPTPLSLSLLVSSGCVLKRSEFSLSWNPACAVVEKQTAILEWLEQNWNAPAYNEQLRCHLRQQQQHNVIRSNKCVNTTSSTPVTVAGFNDANVHLQLDWSWLLGCCSKITSTESLHDTYASAYQLASSTLRLLQSPVSADQLQSDLMDLLGLEAFDVIALLLAHRIELSQIQSADMVDFNPTQQASSGFPRLSSFTHSMAAPLHSSASRVAPPKLSGFTLTSHTTKEEEKARRRAERRMARQSVRDDGDHILQHQREIDQEAIEEQVQSLSEWRSASMASKPSSLPLGTTRIKFKGYEEVIVPANVPGTVDESQLIPITAFDSFARPAFAGTARLNRIQSKCFDAVYKHNDNILVCAPTGAGKTNIAMMAVLREISAHISKGVLQKHMFKIIYVAPMKALAQEVQATFQRRLAPLGIVVKELTGDMQLSKREIEECQLIVTTPEKWDVMTRKTSDGSIHSLVRLLIIDEVHLLHEERGPVIEILVARTLRLVETRQEMCRIVGLSATLPNYKDVALFLGVNVNKGVFFFDSTYRPVPLTQHFIGIQQGSPQNRLKLMNEICYKKTMASVKAGHQVLIFVHSRRDTVKTAKTLLELARECNEAQMFICEAQEGYYLAEKKIKQSRNSELIDLFLNGLGCHHAGMPRGDRSAVEHYFTQGLLKVLVCTATLAWGVNLPSHTVIIKGTQIYDPQRGGFVDLGMLDVMQIFGRAGRPQFDHSGEGIIITEQHDRMTRYLALLNQAMPIESQFVTALPDHLNAEVILGTVSNMQEAITWLGYTYLYIRMLRNPMHYGLEYDTLVTDPTVVERRHHLIANAVKTLIAARMLKCDLKSGQFYPTEVGRVASHYYLTYSSVEAYNEGLRPKMKDEAIFDLLAQSKEFAQIKVRDEEVHELEKLSKKYAPCPILGGLEDVKGKANLLLQAYISNANIDTPTLISDSYFITQSAGRIARALFEMTLKRGLSFLATRFLTLAKEIDRRIWNFQSPLRQFMPHLKQDTIYRIEERQLSVDHLMEMTSSEIGVVLRQTKLGQDVLKCVAMLPYLELDAEVQPITRSVLRLSLTLTPSFIWLDHWHNGAESFWIWIEDGENETIYHSELFVLTKQQARTSHHQLVFTIPVFEPLPPQYYVRCINDRWLGCESILPVSFQHLILPEMYPPHTELLDLKPLPKRALLHPLAESMYGFTHFNPIQTQVFHSVYHTDDNVLLGAPTGSGKTVIAELALLRQHSIYPGSKTVYIAPLKALARERLEDWSRPKSLVGQLGFRIVELTGDHTPEVHALELANLIITTPEKWDAVSRNWHSRQYIQKVSLLIIDEIHLLGSDRGAILEILVSRLRFISAHTLKDIRVIGLSTALANARDLGDWLGIPSSGLFNFPPSVRPVPLSIHIAGFPGKAYCPRMATMNRPCYGAILTHSPTKPVLIFVSSRRQTRLTALDIISYSAGDGNPRKFLHMSEQELLSALETIADSNLKHMLSFGIGMHHAGLAPNDRAIVERLYLEQKIQLLVCTSTLAWGLNFPAHLVIIKGTEYFDAKLSRYVDFPITDVLQMMGRAGRPQFDKSGVAVILVHEPKKQFYINFLHSPFPVESALKDQLADPLNAEISAQTVCSIFDACDWLSWTFLFRRLLLNPSYYGLEDVSAEGLNSYLQYLIKRNVDCLVDAGMVTLDDKRLVPTNLGHIASMYYLRHETIRVFVSALSFSSTLQRLLEVLSDAAEFGELPVRHNENLLNVELGKSVRWPPRSDSFSSPHTKAFLMYQCVFSHVEFPISDYYTDCRSLLDQSLRVLQSMLDVSAEHGWLQTTRYIGQLLPMVVQARWHDDSTLLNVPHFENATLRECFSAHGITDLGQLLVMEETERHRIARIEGGLDATQYKNVEHYLRRVPQIIFEAKVITSDCSSEPNMETKDSLKTKKQTQIGTITDALSHKGKLPKASEALKEDDINGIVLEDEMELLQHLSGGYVHINVQLRRTNVERCLTVMTHPFLRAKNESWLLIIGNPKRDELVLVKRINSLKTKLALLVSFPAPPEGVHVYTIYLLSDSYLGIDQECTVTVHSTQKHAVELPLPEVRFQPVTFKNPSTWTRSSRTTWLDRVRLGSTQQLGSDKASSSSTALNDNSSNRAIKAGSNQASWIDSIAYSEDDEDDSQR